MEPRQSRKRLVTEESSSPPLSNVSLPAVGRRKTADNLDFRRLREMVAMRDVLALLNWQTLSRRGAQLRGACPVHQSNDETCRSFSVNLDRAAFQCFKCGARGNQLDLYSVVRKLTVLQAANELCERLNLERPLLLPPKAEE